MRKILKQSFDVHYNYDVYFTRGLFEVQNSILREIVKKQAAGPAKILVFIDERVARAQPSICKQIEEYAKSNSDTLNLIEKPICFPGSEMIKNSARWIISIYKYINKNGLCRHSYVLAIGGGALLDAVGFAVATAHRGIRLIRVPTTVLSQDDSGVGVKNGINFFGKKNYVGTFAPPYAVLNDFNFLDSLEERDRISGIAEAVKVSLIKDADFFQNIRRNATQINQGKNSDIIQDIIIRSAELHLNHIGTQGDPFELGSSRPLDFGHWSAHKLEQLTNHRLRHGEAVAIGVALDCVYSQLTGLLSLEECEQVLEALTNLGLTLYVPELSQQIDDPAHPESIFKGLVEFREHLGGILSIMMLKKIGAGIEVHAVEFDKYREAINILKYNFAHKEVSQS